MTTDNLAKIIFPKVLPAEKLQSIVDALNQTFLKYNISTTQRQRHFLAQILHESGGFKYVREIWGPTPAQLRYEGRKDLGNIQSGDGKRFLGRGWIQITGRANYAAVGKEFDIDCISNPVLLEQPPYIALTAGWFWKTRGINTLADANDIKGVTKRINGGLNGLEDRQKWFEKVKQILI